MKVKTSLFSELRGSLKQAFLGEKPTCRTRADGTIILQHRPVPTDARTPAQNTQRLAYRACCTSWNDLPPEDKAVYNLNAQPLFITGFNLYMRTCLEAPVEKLYERYITSVTQKANCYGADWRGQIFTVGNTGINEAHNSTKVVLKLSRRNDPGMFFVSIRAVDVDHKPTGADLCIGSIDGNAVTDESLGEWYEIYLSAVELQPSTEYAFCLRAPDGDGTNQMRAMMKTQAAIYTGGTVVHSTDSGASWGINANYDLVFQEFGVKA